MSISHEREYAVAIAFGVRTEGGEFVFPVDVEARLDDREKQLMARLRKLRDLDAEVRTAEAEAAAKPNAGRMGEGSPSDPRPRDWYSTRPSPRPCCPSAIRAATRAPSDASWSWPGRSTTPVRR